jgi:ketosteroid isomerase-like protein
LTPILSRLNIFLRLFQMATTPARNKGTTMVKIGLRGLAATIALVSSLSMAHSALANFDGFGTDIPLESAAKQIAPEGTTVNYADGVDRSTSLTFSKAADWKSSLSSAVAKKGLKADFADGTVTISKAEKAARPYSSAPSKEMVQKKTHAPRHRAAAQDPKPRVARETAQVNDVPAQGSGGFTIRPYRSARPVAEATQPVADKHLEGKEIVTGRDWKPVGDAKGTYIVEEGYMLRQTISSWAEAAGWKIVWESEHDYVIEAHAEFPGDFFDASSALFTAMKDARPSITVVYHKGNKVLVVSNHSADSVN